MIIGIIVRDTVHMIISNAHTVTDDIMTSFLPDDAQGEIPVGFAIVGHIGTALPICMGWHKLT